ncbi:EF hand [Tistlia consotensis]|uniref:EF hand n=1 Tax=Tistlia consotensis USBA 355 TaxID=560819 RepID=A0A1Y6CJY0_9PROT|nr:EF-hand domain-containing protein [Tistlia consotensis]SMF67305.1 EF hand [Tistlia consotensis USBA 355]SNS00046.1 EF hand [Tistlia consotensis]
MSISSVSSLISSLQTGLTGSTKTTSSGTTEQQKQGSNPTDQVSLSPEAQALMAMKSLVIEALSGSQPQDDSSVGTDYSGKMREQIFKMADLNQDGVVSQAELEKQAQAGGASKAAADALFKAIDKNGDGGITQDEFKQAAAAQKGSSFGKEMAKLLDLDGDGKVTLAEIEKALTSAGKSQKEASGLAPQALSRLNQAAG